MSSSAMEPDIPDLVCRLDNVQGMVDALTTVRWKRHQDAVMEISEHGIVLIIEETRCLQAKVYLQKELFIQYEYNAQGRPRFGVGLGLLVDSLNTFSVPGHATTIEIRYPGPDMQLLFKYKYRFLRATTCNLPASVVKENRGSKFTLGRGGLLKVQHLVSVARPGSLCPHDDSAGCQPPSRIAFIEFFLKPEEDEPATIND